ncbi:MAG: hypothetical protein QNI99_08820 [Woeseiaceae bacterium]|nr:hypothetical protein [Woeseiaceae bacterium]
MTFDRRIWLGALLLGTAGLVAADDELPEMEFLEYLGMWEESDDEWLALEDDEVLLASDSEERIDPAPDGEESKENDDES